MPASSRSTRVTIQTLIVAIIAVAGLWFRRTVEYTSDEPLGMRLGAIALGLILLALLTAFSRKGKGAIGRFARSQHCFLGALALVAVVVHVQPRGRQWPGIAAAIIVALIVLSFVTKLQRRQRWIHRCHKWLGYLLPLIVILHAVMAVISTSN